MAYKPDYDKALTRLVIILSRLNDGEELSVKELAEEFGVSIRTVQRDFNDRLVGRFPIYQDKRKWKIQDGFKLEKTTSLEDRIVLDILDGMISGSSGKFSTRAKELLKKLKNDDVNPIYTKLDLEDISDKLQEIKLLEPSIKNRQLITYIYQFKGYKKQLEVKPLKIVNYEGFWYLIALDSRNDKLKKYYLKNITDVKIIDKTFKTNTNLDKLLEDSISIWFNKDKTPFEVKLFISKMIAKYFKRKPISSSQKITKKHKDGSIEISLFISHDMEIIPLIKYWIPHVKVIEPIYIRDIIVDEIEGYANYFK